MQFLTLKKRDVQSNRVLLLLFFSQYRLVFAIFTPNWELYLAVIAETARYLYHRSLHLKKELTAARVTLIENFVSTFDLKN